MKRDEFVKLCGLLGLSIPLQPLMSSCNPSSTSGLGDDFDGTVLIIGAGAAGITTGHLLAQRGIDFRILEASDRIGGRIKTTDDFVDFPISLGGEWLHVQKNILSQAVNDSSVDINIPTTPYDLENDYGLYEGNRISVEQVGFTIDQKFIGSSWLDFFRQYLLPSVENQITFNQIVSAIDYSGDQIQVSTQNETYTADRVVITVPVKLLQNNGISFSPELPSSKREALSNVRVWDGFKAFIEFSEKFYPAFVGFDIGANTFGEMLYYDAAYGQNSNRQCLRVIQCRRRHSPLPQP